MSATEGVEALRSAENSLREGDVWRWAPPEDDHEAVVKWTSLSSDCRDFIERCLALPASERPAAQDLLAHPFLK